MHDRAKPTSGGKRWSTPLGASEAGPHLPVDGQASARWSGGGGWPLREALRVSRPELRQGGGAVDMRARAAAMFLAPWPVEDIEAFLDAAVSRTPGEPDATVGRTANAAAALARVDRRTAWRMLAAACEWRIGRIRTTEDLQPAGEPRTPWVGILWANALDYVERAGDTDPDILQVARALTAEPPWSGTLIELLTTARTVLDDEPAPAADARR